MAPKAKKVEEEVVAEAVAPEAEAPVAEPVVEEEVESKSKDKFPEVRGNGKFQSVKHGKGEVVYNPAGTRVTGVVSADEAKEIVLRQNSAGGFK